MKRILVHIFLIISLLSEWGGEFSHAQTRYSFDTDIHSIRNSIIPNFHYTYDDWLQYGPAAVMVGLKAAGYEGRSSWGRMLTSDAFSAGFMAIAVNGVKYSVGRLRPDGIALSIITDSNFKFKAFADFESVNISPIHPWLNTAVVGWSSAWFW